MPQLDYINLHATKFSSAKFEEGELWFAGRANIEWSALSRALGSGKFPYQIRGNFAFVWKGVNGDFVAAVDHLASTPLFYSEKNISNNFYELKKTLKAPTSNPKPEIEIQLLGGQTYFGEETTIKEIRRIRPCHFLKNGKQECFLNLFLHKGNEDLRQKDFIELVESKVKDLARNQNTLLLSGGTDSTALAGIIKKIGLENHFEFVHIYSEHQALSENHVVESIADRMKLRVNHLKVNFSGGILPEERERQFSFWVDNPFLAKRKAIELAGLQRTRIFTGELGDQLFGGPKNPTLLNYAAQAKSISSKEVAAIWINLSASYGKCGGYIPNLKLQNLMEEDYTARIAYQELLGCLAHDFDCMQTDDLLNKFMLLNYLVKGPYRTWAYSQDELDWVHPFADWEIFDFMFRLKSSVKFGEGGMAKWLLLDSWRSYVSEIPWNIPKHGLGIPSIEKIRAEH